MKIKLLFLIIIISFSSCIGIRIKGTKSAKKYYEEFFIDQGVMQYFIKPLEFKGDKENLFVDFTFRDSVSYQSFITLNYSIYTFERVKDIDSAFFIINDKKIDFNNCEELFIKKSKKYEIRNSCKITYEEFMKIVEVEPEIWAYFNNKKHVFLPTKNAKTGLLITKNQIIDIIELNRD
jgi:hypothetical protein